MDVAFRMSASELQIGGRTRCPRRSLIPCRRIIPVVHKNCLSEDGFKRFIPVWPRKDGASQQLDRAVYGGLFSVI